MTRFLPRAAAAWLEYVAMAAGAQTPGIAADQVLIGAFGPITGPASFVGLAGRDGAALAFKEINAAGGVHVRKLQMQFEDDAHSPVRAPAAVMKLVEVFDGILEKVRERSLPRAPRCWSRNRAHERYCAWRSTATCWKTARWRCRAPPPNWLATRASSAPTSEQPIGALAGTKERT